MFAWELKRSKDEVYYKSKQGLKLGGRTSLQWHTIKKIRSSGGIADFVYPENFQEKLEELLTGPKYEELNTQNPANFVEPQDL